MFRDASSGGGGGGVSFLLQQQQLQSGSFGGRTFHLGLGSKRTKLEEPLAAA
jgi:hypothetical protein